MKTLAIVLFAVILSVFLFIVTPKTIKAQTQCQEVPKSFHHTAGWSIYWDRLMTSGTVKVFPKTGDVIAFVRIAECGGKYLIGIWRRGQFNTHFLVPWSYVQAQIAGFTAATWAEVMVTSFWLIIAPCPGTYMGHPDAWTRPCPSSTS